VIDQRLPPPLSKPWALLALLRLACFEELNVAYRVGCDDAADGPDAITRVDHLFVRVQNEIRSVDNFSPLFPEGAYFVRVSGHFKSVGNRLCT
jgi:hypothetical protein